MTQWVRLCTMNLIRRACVMRFMARDRLGVVARMRIVRIGQRSACFFRGLKFQRSKGSLYRSC